MKLFNGLPSYLLVILVLCGVALLLLLAYELTLGKKKKEVLTHSILLKKANELNQTYHFEYAPIAETRVKDFSSSSAFSSYTKAKAKKEFGKYGKEGEAKLKTNLSIYESYEKEWNALKEKYLGSDETLNQLKISKKKLIHYEEEALAELKFAKPENDYSIYVEVNLNLENKTKSKSYTLTHEDFD